MRLPYVVVIALGLAGACSKQTTPMGPGGVAKVAPNGTGMLVSVTSGDAACYVVLNIEGKEQTIPGHVQPCRGGGADATKLAGKQVSYTTKPGTVAAQSCQGDPECKTVDKVD